jgi:DNA-binding transcriptional MerR regulator
MNLTNRPSRFGQITDFASQMVQTVAYNPPREGLHPGCSRLLDLNMALQLSTNRSTEAPVIPDRLYFKIGDVARICCVETYVLRFWETQFPQLKPNKSGTGQRLYRRRDVELALKIKHLVHTEGYTLAGARQALEQVQAQAQTQVHRLPEPLREFQRDPQSRLPLLAAGSAQPLDDLATALADARAELREIAALLAAPGPQASHRRVRLATMPSSTDSLLPFS